MKDIIACVGKDDIIMRTEIRKCVIIGLAVALSLAEADVELTIGLEAQSWAVVKGESDGS